MILIRAVLLGILQAVTEFFPLSNSAHIIFFQRIFHYRKSYMAYDVVIDVGTILAICIYYAKDIVKIVQQAPILIKVAFVKNKTPHFQEYPYALTLSLLMISSIATAMVRFAFIEVGDMVSGWLPAIGAVWIIMGILLFRTKDSQEGFRTAFEMNHQDAFLIGLVQGLTIFPGVARFGICLIAAMSLGIDRKESARYSLLLGIPYIASALVYKVYTGTHFYQSDQAALLVSFIVTVIAGIIVIPMALRIIRRGELYLFGFYCVAIGMLAIANSFVLRVF